MQRPEQRNQQAADLHWLAFLLTGCCETGVDLVVETIASQDADSPFFSDWMLAWSRRVVIGKALNAIRTDLARSARSTQLKRTGNTTLPPGPGRPIRAQRKYISNERCLPSMRFRGPLFSYWCSNVCR